MLIGPDRVESDEVIEVHSPYDDRLVGVVARGGTGHLEAGLQAGKRVLADGPMPAHQRAEILDRAAARLAGISERRVKLFVFAYTGVLVGIATLVSAPQLTVIQSNTGEGFELLVVTCVVVGGTAISGGRGTVGSGFGGGHGRDPWLNIIHRSQ